MSSKNFNDDFQQLKQFEYIKFLSVSELFDGSENLSADRLQVNLKLNGSLVTRHRLLPDFFNFYPLSGLFYSLESANKMYLYQILTSILFYGIWILVVIIMTMVLLHCFSKHFKFVVPLTVIVSLGGFFVLFSKTLSDGLYMNSAIGLVCCLGLLTGAVLSKNPIYKK
ncbi:MAG: hypothetical protein GQ532_21430 [Methylomarinum sp.]|nr:hypothetical protein [Methylomarinum sp.]